MIETPTIAINFDYKIDNCNGRPVYSCPGAYIDELAAFGITAIPILPLGMRKAVMKNIIDMVDGVVFIGGADYPSAKFNYPSTPHEGPMAERRANSDADMFSVAWLSSKPILGICGGAQLAALACGGKLIPHLDGDHAFHQSISATEDSMHLVKLEAGRLQSVFSAQELMVNSSHHQAIDPENLPEALMVTAVALDGVIEAVERRRKGVGIFVQWHPERHPDPEHRKKLFGTFAAAVKYGYNKRTT